jgi:dTDP-6-deoxy-L-talose 4-dehydrogenase (NAD+)
VVRALLDRGISVTAVDIDPDPVDGRATKIALDIFSSSNDIYEHLHRPTACLHLAWTQGFMHNSSAHITNLPRHLEFIQALLDGGLKQLAVMGSMHEVGHWYGEIDENTPTNPVSMYGIAKNSLRQAVQVLAKERGFVLQWLRAFYIVGDDENNNSVFSQILKNHRQGKTAFPFTSGEHAFDFIEIEDLALQIVACVLQTDVTGIINCCSGQPVALREMVRRYIEANHLNIQPSFGEFPDRPYESPATWGNVAKIQAIMQQSASKGRQSRP